MWEPAREGGVSVEISIGWDGLFAGKPAPTGFVCWLTGLGLVRNCVSVEVFIGWDGLFAGKPAPTGFVG
ncbi:hypothetical protein PS710_02202 [Pseudomonas fluorescens]|uniref:Uncharacterized protein n=1 Tax=Pseudomonas fluorescens TaxID=294 RepID=A0A5E7CHM7_PSEFL|nr:hypothetical protein PS710_02202 [Pseudomonas fluorescens]